MRIHVSSAVVAVTFLLVGCTGGDGSDPTASPTVTIPTAGSATSTPTEAGDPTPSPSTPAPPASPSSEPTSEPPAEPAFEPFTVELGEQVSDDESGIEVELHQVEVRPDGLVVEITSFNNTDEPAVLAAQPGAVFVFDVDTLRNYIFRAPEDNPTLRYAPGEELTANVAFPAQFNQPPVDIEVAFNYDAETASPLGEDAVDDAQVVQVLFGDVPLEQSSS